MQHSSVNDYPSAPQAFEQDAQRYGQNQLHGQDAGQQVEQRMGGQQYGEHQQADQSYGQQSGDKPSHQQMPNQHTGGEQTGPQTNGHGGASEPDNRDTLTKWLDRIEKKFGGDRFNNHDNDAKNKALNENILKRLKQVGTLVMQRGPSMVMQYIK